MFEQWHRIKAQVPNALLFFRMGDFYELFYEDAKVAARELELTLTARNKDDPDAIPMAGVPHHAAGGYVQRLTEAGYRVAIAEQVEDPALAKGLVRRELVRVVTPGVVFDPTQLEQRTPNYLAAIARTPDGWGLALLDCSTGELVCTSGRSAAEIGAECVRLEPRELICGPGVDVRELARWVRGVLVSPAVDGSFELPVAAHTYRTVTGREPDADGLTGPELAAVGGALGYGLDVSGSQLGNVGAARRYATAGFMVLDEPTRRNLELVRTLRTGQRKGSLLHLLDRTATALGGRQLRAWLAFPLLDPARIRARCAGVEAFVEDPSLRQGVRERLQGVGDIERIVARVTQGTAHARDLAALGRALTVAPALFALVRADARIDPPTPPDLVGDVQQDIVTWLVDEPPQVMTEGGLVPEGAHAELDQLARLSLDGIGVLEDLEARERDASGISSLKLRRNKVFGYYLEVTTANLHRVPDRWLRKQTLSNCERYVTPELKELEDRVLGADERRKRLEFELFCALRERVAQHAGRLQALARRIARLDALAALGEVAVTHGWVRPDVDESRELAIRAGRHPVVEASLDEERFVPNDLDLDASCELVVLTGPNMAGKSTVMRQTALIVLLAQMGSFVPADAARIGLCDRIFTRVGAADDLGRGQSTFMVEMSETATILHEATDRSLVLLDEIGRGTSTYDGLAIAWAVAEDLADRTRARTIFATHYHELCDLAETRDNVVNRSVAVSESGEDVVFLRRLKPGGASRSYGIQCARLAGLPDPVVARARTLLDRFERHAPRNERQQLSLFARAPSELADAAPDPSPSPDPALEALARAVDVMDPDALTPKAALDALYALKALRSPPRG